MVQQSPTPTKEELQVYYSTEYRQDYKKTYKPKPKYVFRAGNIALDRIGFLHKGDITQGRLLDIGAGGGEFTYLSNEMGFDSKGVEPNIGYSNYARDEYGINIQTGQLDDVVGSYQVITMFHVLEHLPNPTETFKILSELLEKDGCLFIEVPNIESKDASPNNIFFKAHINYFSEATLIAAASSYFDVITSDNSGNLRVLFKKRNREVLLKLPTKTQVQHTHERLRRKGWLEYLLLGGGVTKIFFRVKVIVQDLFRPKQKSLVILQALINK